MKVGDLVVCKANSKRLLGIVIRLYCIFNLYLHREPLPMAEVATEKGIFRWKCRKLKVISENNNE